MTEPTPPAEIERKFLVRELPKDLEVLTAKGQPVLEPAPLAPRPMALAAVGRRTRSPSDMRARRCRART